MFTLVLHHQEATIFQQRYEVREEPIRQGWEPEGISAPFDVPNPISGEWRYPRKRPRDCGPRIPPDHKTLRSGPPTRSLLMKGSGPRFKQAGGTGHLRIRTK